MLSGTEGYAQEAPELVERYETAAPEDIHGPVLRFFPSPPSRVVDIGAGTGRDAAWLARLGHRVVAAEPTREMREAAMRLHATEAIEWLDDGLPDLRLVRERGPFDLVLMTAVFMHLDAAQRASAMPNLVALLAPGGVLSMTLRHGPVPEGRRMFDVQGEEVIGLAPELALLSNERRDSLRREANRAGVTWTQLAFRKP